MLKPDAKPSSVPVKSTAAIVVSLSLLLSGMVALVETMDSHSMFTARVQAQQNRNDARGRTKGGGTYARGQVSGRYRGGGRRGECSNSQIPLTALVPYSVDTSLQSTYVGGITTFERPTFWFYVPYSLTEDVTADFILKDEQGSEVYRTQVTNFPAGQSDRILSIQIPKTAKGLAVGQVYQWYFQVNCKSKFPIYVKGGIERVRPGDASGFQATPMSYDQITALGNRWRSNPQDPASAKEWADLLQSFNITDAALSSTQGSWPR